MNTIVKNEVKQAFNNIHFSKGSIAPLAEKANRNYKLITKWHNKQERLHYFAVGHAFKNIDKKALFGLTYDEKIDEFVPQRFEKLYSYHNFTFDNELDNLLSRIRDINSHSIHDFSVIKTDQYKTIFQFLLESFEVAAIISYIDENGISLESYFDSNHEADFVNFLSNKFNVENKNLKKLSKKEAIHALLFINNPNTFDWLLFNEHKVFEVEKGEYFSHLAQLFLLSMFLYKGEAEKLILKIKGFKRNEDKKENSKRNIFTFFSKKFSSQDINSEESHLIKFRDIIQYLNRYPLVWNHEIEKNTKSMPVNMVMETIIDKEINRLFPDYSRNERFKIYVKYKIWGKKHFGKNIERLYIETPFTSEELKDFNYVVFTSPELKNEYAKLKVAKSEKEKRSIEKDINTLKNKRNITLEKLQKNIEENTLITSYGRNQDRFMPFACRYLAENNYFGENARFKLYMYRTTNEQKDAEKTMDQKTKDNKKYHQGRRVDFLTFNEILEKYPDWDTPFVIENNAIQIELSNGKQISIQRALLVYLLEHALYGNANYPNGESLLNAYISTLEKHKEEKLAILKSHPSLNIEDKPEYKPELKKLFPRRLVKNYFPANEQSNDYNPFAKIWEDALDSEKRYKQLLEEAKQRESSINNNPDNKTKSSLVFDFEKKNKGKNFKLRFIKKAWNLMYFKAIFTENANTYGHHKRFHITKDEYKDYCRYMYAFEEVKTYKERLGKLFDSKGFFKNKEFKQLFDASLTLDSLYEKTKNKFKDWMNKQSKKTHSYAIESYQHIMDPEKHIVYINLSHFIDFLFKEGILEGKKENGIQFKSLHNKDFLLQAYYLKNDTLNTSHKDIKKLFNKLNPFYLEDCLLYEIAMRYLQLDNSILSEARCSVDNILTTKVSLHVNDADNKPLYDLQLPFNKLEAYVALTLHKEEQEKDPKNKKTSFLANLVNYVSKTSHNDLKDVKLYFKENKTLRYEDLNKINEHVMNQSVAFCKVVLTLEEYFIHKYKCVIKSDNRITINDVPGIIKNQSKPYIQKGERDKSFHFGLPVDKGYIERMKEIEEKFINEEVLPSHPTDYKTMLKPIKAVCDVFLETIHNDYFNSYSKGNKRENAENRYYEYQIKNKKIPSK